MASVAEQLESFESLHQQDNDPAAKLVSAGHIVTVPARFRASVVNFLLKHVRPFAKQTQAQQQQRLDESDESWLVVSKCK